MKQLILGQKVESEHTKTISFIKRYLKTHKKLPPNKAIFKSIAKDHLKEDPKYYSKLQKAKL